MKPIDRRLRKLEKQFGFLDVKQSILVIVGPAGAGGRGKSRAIEILRKCGYLPTGPIGMVNFCQMQHGLNAEETERFLRERGAEICYPRGGQLGSFVAPDGRVVDQMKLGSEGPGLKTNMTALA